MDDEKFGLLGYIISSTYRTKSLKAIYQGEETPTHIANNANIKVNHISKVLKELKTKKIAVCINEENKKNRIYKLTSLGEEIGDYMNDKKMF